jgi:hypothetical protein
MHCLDLNALTVFREEHKLWSASAVHLLWYNIRCLPVSRSRSRAWTIFARFKAGIVGSNPTWCMDVCMRLFCVCVVLCVVGGLATGWSPVQGVLPAV